MKNTSKLSKTLTAILLGASWGCAGADDSQDYTAGAGGNNEDPIQIVAKPASAEVFLAQCLVNAGVQIYGANWCGACKIQKELFGKEAWAVMSQNYVDCSPEDNPHGAGISKYCEDLGIEGLPTTIFPDYALKEPVAEGVIKLNEFKLWLPECKYTRLQPADDLDK